MSCQEVGIKDKLFSGHDKAKFQNRGRIRKNYYLQKTLSLFLCDPTVLFVTSGDNSVSYSTFGIHDQITESSYSNRFNVVSMDINKHHVTYELHISGKQNIHSFIIAFVSSFVCSFVRSFVRLLVHSFVYLFVCLFFIFSFIHSLFPSFTHLCIRYFIRPSVHPSVHSFIH